MCALVHYNFLSKNTKGSRGVLPISAMINVVISTFLLLECGFIGFKKHLIHFGKPFYLILIVICLIYVIWWVLCFKVLDDYVALNTPAEEFMDSSER